ncbi:MAG: MFS transporter [Betaproteobacteria bacterium]|nr:MFS transporter [Betaproteobacteria bacterium]
MLVPFCAGYYLSYLLRTVNAVISPTLTQELGLDAADLGLLTSTYFFAFAMAQLPMGIALDRYGPRRVEVILLALAAVGAALFALGHTLVQLALARALIGLGVAACLMAGLKAFAQWYAQERQAALTGLIMAAGAIGAVTASVPVEWALERMGWRGIFLAAAAACAAVALWIFAAVPERPAALHTAGLRAQLRGLADVLRSRSFWTFAPQSALFTGGFMALQSLWVVPWLMEVESLSRGSAAGMLLAVSVGMLAGQLGIALLGLRLERAGVTPVRLMQVGLGLALAVEGLLLAGGGDQAVLWGVWGVASAAGTQMYVALARHFPVSHYGRVTTAINLMAFVGAFGVQWGFGALVDGLRGAFGGAAAFRAAFGTVLALQLGAWLWMLRGTCSRRAPSS